MYSDEEAAALYDTLNPWGPSDDFYFAEVMSSSAVLDVGCGTGTMLRKARAAGHPGRLVGIDPDTHALDIARQCSDVEWLAGDAASIEWSGEFDLAVMMSHVFQCLSTDEDLADSLKAIRRALAPSGRFVFETRNPAARAWEEWDAMDPVEVVDPAGRTVRISYDVHSVVDDVVTFDEVTSEAAGRSPTVDAGWGKSDARGQVLRSDRASLRFLDVDTLREFLAKAGFTIDAVHGDWDRSAFDADSREIIISARRD